MRISIDLLNFVIYMNLLIQFGKILGLILRMYIEMLPWLIGMEVHICVHVKQIIQKCTKYIAITYTRNKDTKYVNYV